MPTVTHPPEAFLGTHLVVVSSDAWAAHRSACEVAVESIACASPARLVVIDRQAAARLRPPPMPAPRYSPLEPGSWLRRETEGYRTDEPALTRVVSGWTAEDTVVIDARAFAQATTRQWLEHMRQVLFDQSPWPKALVLVCRSQDVPRAVDDLVGSFFLMPQGLTPGESAAFVRRFCGLATRMRWMQLAPGLGRRWLSWALRWRERWGRWRDQDTDGRLA